MAAIPFEVNARVPVGFVGYSGLDRYVTSPVMNAVFRRMAEEKKKLYRRGLFRIKIEIVYIYIAGERWLVGGQRTSLRAFVGISQEKWTDGWVDVEGREQR